MKCTLQLIASHRQVLMKEPLETIFAGNMVVTGISRKKGSQINWASTMDKGRNILIVDIISLVAILLFFCFYLLGKC